MHAEHVSEFQTQLCLVTQPRRIVLLLEIAELQRAHTETMRNQFELELTKLQANSMRTSRLATEFVTIQFRLALRMSAFTKTLPNAQPLPAG